MEDDAVVIRLPKLQETREPFLRALYEALQPLAQYKFSDGDEALLIRVRDTADSSRYIEPGAQFGDGGYEPSRDDPERGWWVMTVSLREQGEVDSVEHIKFFSLDFAGEASGAKTGFKQVLQHLLKHVATPTEVPSKIQQALSVLA